LPDTPVGVVPHGLPGLGKMLGQGQKLKAVWRPLMSWQESMKALNRARLGVNNVYLGTLDTH
jgi:hypothetical protein